MTTLQKLRFVIQNMLLYHYYDSKTGPLHNLSDLSDEEANKVLDEIKKSKPNSMCAKRHKEYVSDRKRYEAILRSEFLKKGGLIERPVPHYFVVGKCEWLSSWFEDSAYIELNTDYINTRSISFTYGDSHPTFSDRVNDGKEYRKKLYTFEELPLLIEKYGYPQDWNPDGKFGPERYIEAHIWTDKLKDGGNIYDL